MSQTANEDEVGRVFSCLALQAVLVPLVATPSYGMLYQVQRSPTRGGCLKIVSVGIPTYAGMKTGFFG